MWTNFVVTLPSYLFCPKRVWQKREHMASPWYGYILPGKGFYHRGGNQATRPAYPLQAQLALCPGATQWGHPPCAPPYWRSPECHDGGKHQQHSLWENLPIGSLPTSELRLLSGLPGRPQWMSNPCDNIPAWVIVQGHNHAGRQIHFPTGGSFAIHHTWARV